MHTFTPGFKQDLLYNWTPPPLLVIVLQHLLFICYTGSPGVGRSGGPIWLIPPNRLHYCQPEGVEKEEQKLKLKSQELKVPKRCCHEMKLHSRCCKNAIGVNPPGCLEWTVAQYSVVPTALFHLFTAVIPAPI